MKLLLAHSFSYRAKSYFRLNGFASDQRRLGQTLISWTPQRSGNEVTSKSFVTVLRSRHTYQKRRVVNPHTLDDKKWAMGLKVSSPWPVHHSVKPIPYTAIVAFKRGRQAMRRERKLERKVVISGLKLCVTSVLKRTLQKTTINEKGDYKWYTDDHLNRVKSTN